MQFADHLSQVLGTLHAMKPSIILGKITTQVITVTCDANKMLRLFDLTWTVSEGNPIFIPPSVWNHVPPEARTTKTYMPTAAHDVWMYGTLLKALLASVISR